MYRINFKKLIPKHQGNIPKGNINNENKSITTKILASFNEFPFS